MNLLYERTYLLWATQTIKLPSLSNGSTNYIITPYNLLYSYILTKWPNYPSTGHVKINNEWIQHSCGCTWLDLQRRFIYKLRNNLGINKQLNFTIETDPILPWYEKK